MFQENIYFYLTDFHKLCGYNFDFSSVKKTMK